MKATLTKDYFSREPVIRVFADSSRKCFIDYEIPDFDIDIEINDDTIQFDNGKIIKTSTDEEERYA